VKRDRGQLGSMDPHDPLVSWRSRATLTMAGAGVLAALVWHVAVALTAKDVDLRDLGTTFSALLSGHPLSDIPGSASVSVTVAVFVVLLLALFGLVVGAVFWWNGPNRRGTRGSKHAEVGFATRQEIVDAFGLHEKASGGHAGRVAGLTFARYLRSPVTSRAQDSALVLAPSGAGKTMRLAAPLVMTATGSIVATSTKADIVRLTGAARQKLGPVHVMDFDRVTGWPELTRWDLVRGCQVGREAMVRSKALVAGRPLGGAKNADFFAETADTVLRCLLHAAALEGASVRDVQRWARDFDDEDPYAILRRHPEAMPGWVEDLRKYCRSAAPETVASTNMSLGLIMKPLADPDIVDLLCPESGTGFDVDEFVHGEDPQSLYIVTEGGGEASAAPLVTALVASVERAGRRASQAGESSAAGYLKRSITFVLDEAPNIAPLPNLPAMLADGGSRGMPVWVFAQSPSQLRERWGRDGLDLIADPAAIELIFGGLEDNTYLERVSRLCGDRMINRNSYSTSPGSQSTSVSEQRERVLPVEQIRTLGEGKPLLLYRSMRPAIVEVDGWWERPDKQDFIDSLDAAKEAERKALHLTEESS
jgi:type IV secretion system protein VirD4